MGYKSQDANKNWLLSSKRWHFLSLVFLQPNYAKKRPTSNTRAVIGYIEKLHYSNKYSDRPIMTDSEFFVTNSDVPYVDMSFIVGDNDLEDFTLMGIDSEDTNRYHVLYSKGKYDIFYGNVSSEWDFDGYDTGAVIGKNGDVPGAKILDYIDDDGIYAKSRAVFMFGAKHPYMAVAAGFLMVSIFACVLQLILYLILSDSSYII